MTLRSDERFAIDMIVRHVLNAAEILNDLVRDHEGGRGLPLPRILALYKDSERELRVAREHAEKGRFDFAFQRAMVSYALIFNALKIIPAANDR